MQWMRGSNVDENVSPQIAELQKEITSWQKNKKNILDVATQTDEAELTPLNGAPGNAIPEQVRRNNRPKWRPNEMGI